PSELAPLSLHDALPICALADEILLQLELLVGLGVHEHKRVALLVEKGEVLLLEPDLLHRLGGAEALVELGAVDEVLQFDLVVGADRKSTRLNSSHVKIS